MRINVTKNIYIISRIINKKHKGCLIIDHLEALIKYGPCEIHRMSYKPVKESIKK